MFQPAHENPSNFHYTDHNADDRNCIHVVLSDRAYSQIINDVLMHGDNETGMVFLGNIYQRVWYVTECVPAGVGAQNSRETFTLDLPFVNYMVQQLSGIYRYPVTILGFWHRHPGSLDRFSAMDMLTIGENLKNAGNGLLSMLVNVDPELRMTFYHAKGDRLMRVYYDHGDEYFPEELLEMAKPEEIIARSEAHAAAGLQVKESHWLEAEELPRHIAECVPEESDAAPENPPCQSEKEREEKKPLEEAPLAAEEVDKMPVSCERQNENELVCLRVHYPRVRRARAETVILLRSGGMIIVNNDDRGCSQRRMMRRMLYV